MQAAQYTLPYFLDVCVFERIDSMLQIVMQIIAFRCIVYLHNSERKLFAKLTVVGQKKKMFQQTYTCQ
jgi:hypothetical protein